MRVVPTNSAVLCLAGHGGSTSWLAAMTGAPGTEDRPLPLQGPPARETDLDDVRASLRGDGEAYARLVRRHQHAVAARFGSFTRDDNAVEELTQEVFVEAYFALDGYRGEAPLAHWLNRIATRVGYRFWKRRRREAKTEPLGTWDGAAGTAAGTLGCERAAELLDGLLARLKPRDRLVLTLLYIEDRSVAEAAELIGWSRTMVKVQAFRARRRLRRLLEAREKRAPQAQSEEI